MVLVAVLGADDENVVVKDQTISLLAKYSEVLILKHYPLYSGLLP